MVGWERHAFLGSRAARAARAAPRSPRLPSYLPEESSARRQGEPRRALRQLPASLAGGAENGESTTSRHRAPARYVSPGPWGEEDAGGSRARGGPVGGGGALTSGAGAALDVRGGREPVPGPAAGAAFLSAARAAARSREQ